MDVHLPSDLRRLQDRHRLHDKRVGDAQFLTNLPGARGVGDILEDLVVLVESMPDFVDGLPLGGHQFAALEGLGLEEEADLVGRLEEVGAETVLGGAVGVEDGGGLGGGLELVDQSVDLVDGGLAELGGDEVGYDCVAVGAQVLARLLYRQLQSFLHGWF